MNWIALGAVGELVGGVVVVITLIYLAAQIRQNTRATRVHATAALASEMERNLLAVAENDALAEVFLKAAQGAELSPLESTRLLFWWASFIRNSESHILQSDLRTMGEDVNGPIRVVLRQFLQVPALRDSLQNMIDQGANTKTFRDWVVKNVLS